MQHLWDDPGYTSAGKTWADEHLGWLDLRDRRATRLLPVANGAPRRSDRLETIRFTWERLSPAPKASGRIAAPLSYGTDLLLVRRTWAAKLCTPTTDSFSHYQSEDAWWPHIEQATDILPALTVELAHAGAASRAGHNDDTVRQGENRGTGQQYLLAHSETARTGYENCVQRLVHFDRSLSPSASATLVTIVRADFLALSKAKAVDAVP